MKRLLLFTLAVFALAGALWLMWAPQVPEPDAPTMPDTTLGAESPEDTGSGEILEGEPAPGDEFQLEALATEEASPEGLYQDLRDAVDSIPRSSGAERDGIAPQLTLPPLPQPTLDDDDEEPVPS